MYEVCSVTDEFKVRVVKIRFMRPSWGGVLDFSLLSQ